MEAWDGWPFARLYMLLVAVAFVVLGLQVLLFHWRAGFRHWTMYGPVLLAPAIVAAGVVGALQRDGLLGWLALAVFALGIVEERCQPAARVFVCGYAIETPRLLLNSGNLANSSDQVGRNLIVHSGPIVYGRFHQPLDSFVTPPVGVMTMDTYPSDASRGFVRGFWMNTYCQFPINFAQSLVGGNPDLWGRELMDVLDEYAHWGMLATLGEVLPNPDNRITLADERDDNGVPVARVTFSYGGNDRAIVQAERELAEKVMEAAGATRILTSDGTHHVLGTCRMGADAATSVVGPDCRSHGVPNLWICDGSVFPTGGAVNPSLTIEAIATRTARLALASGDEAGRAA